MILYLLLILLFSIPFLFLLFVIVQDVQKLLKDSKFDKHHLDDFDH